MWISLCINKIIFGNKINFSILKGVKDVIFLDLQN